MLSESSLEKIRNRAADVQRAIFKGTVLMLLAMGAYSPIFRDDAASIYVAAVSIAILVALAGVAVFGKPKRAS